ncbi:hypothetical protein ACQ5SK_33080 [Bradyrhizobium japonicum]
MTFSGSIAGGAGMGVMGSSLRTDTKAGDDCDGAGETFREHGTSAQITIAQRRRPAPRPAPRNLVNCCTPSNVGVKRELSRLLKEF